jgi:replicative DNA helicase
MAQASKSFSDQPEFQSLVDRLPPQNIDAEEAILGGILVDPEAMGRIMDIMQPEGFYLAAHRVLFEAALALSAQNKPTDLMNMATFLQDRGVLEKVGGQGKLVEMVDRTVSAVNIDQYALLVMEKYARRRLIKVGQEISELGHDTAQEFEMVLDSAEQKVFNITQSRPQEGLVATAEVLTQTFAEIEGRSVGLSMPGLACGFYDLDGMTQGFQRGDLIIVAGRPSMGKTSFVLNVARNVASYHKLPVAVFSLEMSKEQLVQRLLSGEVRIESSRLRAGRISSQEWEPLGHAISMLSQMPIFIDDTSGISLSEMRSRLRRLQAENGGAIGLVIVDYLQLMESKGSDNRVQALSNITRALKGLAREFSVPVIALSQLSRSVESRNDKRPLMSDLRECVTGETLVMLADGRRVPIRDLVGQAPEVLAMTPDEKITVSYSDKVWSVGVKPVFEVKLASGRSIKTTAKHRIYGAEGWRKLQDLGVGDRVAIATSKSMNYAIQQATLNQTIVATMAGPLNPPILGDFELGSMARLPQTWGLGGGSAVQLLDRPKVEKATSDLCWDEIISITPAGEEEVFDLTVPGPASWLADGIVSHNSGAIEQDADLIMMLYRDEYYNKDTPDRGLAEIIINKHRNGPTGTVKLLFEPQFTQFRNLATANRDS